MAQIQTEMEDITNEAKNAEERAKKAITDVRILLWFGLFFFKFSGLPNGIAAGSYCKYSCHKLDKESVCGPG